MNQRSWHWQLGWWPLELRDGEETSLSGGLKDLAVREVAL